jgi:hypothetical protein
MLPLTDPLWQKLDGAFRDKDFAKMLSEIAETCEVRGLRLEL